MWWGDHRAVTRAFLFIAVATGSLVLAAGCGREESELCQVLGDLQESVQGLRDIELGEGALDDLQQSADEINANVAAVENAAGEEVGPEVANFKTSAAALVADVEAAAAQEELTREALGDLADSVSSAATAFEALREAAPECDL